MCKGHGLSSKPRRFPGAVRGRERLSKQSGLYTVNMFTCWSWRPFVIGTIRHQASHQHHLMMLLGQSHETTLYTLYFQWHWRWTMNFSAHLSLLHFKHDANKLHRHNELRIKDVFTADCSLLCSRSPYQHIDKEIRKLKSKTQWDVYTDLRTPIPSILLPIWEYHFR